MAGFQAGFWLPTAPFVLPGFEPYKNDFLRKKAEYDENYQRSDFSWQEEIEHTFRVDELYREFYGSRKGGKPNCSESEQLKWSLRKTANLIGNGQLIELESKSTSVKQFDSRYIQKGKLLTLS